VRVTKAAGWNDGKCKAWLRHSILANGKRALGIVFVATALYACRHSARDPVTLSYFRLGWSQPDGLPLGGPLAAVHSANGHTFKEYSSSGKTLDELDLSRKPCNPIVKGQLTA